MVALASPSSLSAPPAASASSSTLINAQEVAQVNFPQIHWHVDAGRPAYEGMLKELRDLAVSNANARRTGTIIDTNGVPRNVTILDNTRTNNFADIVITSSTVTVHAVVRLSDLYVVRVYTLGTAHNRVLNLIGGLPNAASTDDNYFVGSEGYDALAASNRGNIALTSVTLGPATFANAVYELANPRTTRPNQARNILRLIFGISEAARFNPIANRIAGSFDTGNSATLSAHQVALIRSWAKVSHVLVGRTNGTDPGASTSVAGSSIGNARQAAALLATALNDGRNPNPKDEL
ncbi:ribosome-inactivating family protein [Streptomyces sp. NPDC101152]|uniref:ribosome-inactivating family protein n=1 Tax=Streptomyces sp. NPDC101152 TaxID=3366116 RepID=UPI0037FD24ED